MAAKKKKKKKGGTLYLETGNGNSGKRTLSQGGRGGGTGTYPRIWRIVIFCGY